MPRTKKAPKPSADAKTDKSKHKRFSGGVHPFWSGTISFGLVSVPVNVYPASRRVGASFRMLDHDGTPLSRQYYCPEHDHPVHPEHIIRGYPVGEDEYVVVRDEELKSLQPRKSRDIDVQQFVDRDSVPPLLFERAYFLTPAGNSNKAYRLLAEVMQESGRVGIATFVMRDKEYLVAVLAEGGVLRAETLRFHDEVREPEDVGLPPPVDVPKARVSQCRKAIQALRQDKLDLSQLQDESEQQLQSLVEQKLKRGTDVVEQPDQQTPEESDPEEAPTVDLIETIRRSLRQEESSSPPSKNGQDSDPLKELSKDELYERAQQLDIAGRSRMNKQALIKAIQSRSDGM